MLASTKFQRFIKIGFVIQKWQQNKMRTPKIWRFPGKNQWLQRAHEPNRLKFWEAKWHVRIY